MKIVLDVRLGCCVLDKEKLIQGLRQLSFGESLEVIADNAKSMKELIQKFAEKENCRVIETVDGNGETRLTIEKRDLNEGS